MIKNYTSSVSASRSIAFIELQLSKNGARDILKRYENEKVSAIMFTIPINGTEIPFKLPAKLKECEQILMANLSPRAQSVTRKKIPEQAERTCWKIISDWVESQLAMIELSQVEVLEIFLPFVYDRSREQTFFEKIKEKNYIALLPGGE